MGKLYVGWAEESLVPEKKVSLAGQFFERISEYVESEITATAMAVEAGNDQMVIVSCDLVGTNWMLTCAVRDILKDNTCGLDPKKVILSAIHTHTGYGCGGGQKGAAKGVINNLREMLETFLKPGQKYIEKANISDNPDVATPPAFDALPGA